MPIRQSLLSALSLPSAGTGGRLGDFRFNGTLAPVLAFVGVAFAIYLWGTTSSLKILTKLWVAYSVAFVMLAGLARLKGLNASWYYVVPTAVIGVVLGGLASTLAALAPNWAVMFDLSAVAREWLIGAAFSAFFVGLSIVTGEVRRREQVVADTKRQLLEARLQMLTAQIEPHFLINTLANLRYLIRKKDRTAEQMLDHLADFLQGALERSRSPRSTLGQEMRLVESYLSIMQIRLGERLRFSTAIPGELEDVPFPPLLLQTLVENAVNHGIEPHDGDGMINVEVRQDGPRIVVCVMDNGVGFDSSEDCTQGHGLRNTRQRLETFYGGRASLALADSLPSGAVATISIPSARVA